MHQFRNTHLADLGPVWQSNWKHQESFSATNNWGVFGS